MENKNNVKVSLYYSKYQFKQDSLANKEIIYEGQISDCPEELLENVKVAPGQKLIRVYTKKI
jgi:hypothetical protein